MLPFSFWRCSSSPEVEPVSVAVISCCDPDSSSSWRCNGEKMLGDQQQRMNDANQKNNTRLWEVWTLSMHITMWTAAVGVSLSKPSSRWKASPWVVEWGRLFSVAVCSQTELSAWGLALACGKHTYWGKPRWRIEIRIFGFLNIYEECK